MTTVDAGTAERRSYADAWDEEEERDMLPLAYTHDSDGGLRRGRADMELQRTLLGEAIDEAPVLVFVADEEGRYVAVNRQACEVLRYSRRQLLGMTVSEVAVCARGARSVRVDAQGRTPRRNNSRPLW